MVDCGADCRACDVSIPFPAVASQVGSSTAGCVLGHLEPPGQSEGGGGEPPGQSESGGGEGL